MGNFVRVTLAVALAIVVFAVLILILKLLVVAAILAVAAVGIACLIRVVRLRLSGPGVRRRVTALTARR